MIVAVPCAIPVARPEDEPIVATLPLLLLHVPPVTASVNDEVTPAHTAGPVIDDIPLTVTVAVAIHAVGAV